GSEQREGGRERDRDILVLSVHSFALSLSGRSLQDIGNDICTKMIRDVDSFLNFVRPFFHQGPHLFLNKCAQACEERERERERELRVVRQNRAPQRERERERERQACALASPPLSDILRSSPPSSPSSCS